MNKLARFGDNGSNILGLTNNPNIPVASVPAVGTGASTLWINKTPDQILRAVSRVRDLYIVACRKIPSKESPSLWAACREDALSASHFIQGDDFRHQMPIQSLTIELQYLRQMKNCLLSKKTTQINRTVSA